MKMYEVRVSQGDFYVEVEATDTDHAQKIAERKLEDGGYYEAEGLTSLWVAGVKEVK